MDCSRERDRSVPDWRWARSIAGAHCARLGEPFTICEKSVQQKSSRKTAFLGRLCKERVELSYGDGDGFTFTFVSVLVSVFVSGAGVSLLMMVVLLSLFSAGGFTVVDFSSQAASKPRPSSRQIVFFIIEFIGWFFTVSWPVLATSLAQLARPLSPQPVGW